MRLEVTAWLISDAAFINLQKTRAAGCPVSPLSAAESQPQITTRGPTGCLTTAGLGHSPLQPEHRLGRIYIDLNDTSATCAYATASLFPGL